MNGWSREDFTKPGLEHSIAVSRFWQPEVKAAYVRPGEALFHLTAPGRSALDFGCPADFFLRYQLKEPGSGLEIELQWFNKTACRMPEAIWFSFVPALQGSDSLEIEKLGEWLSPLNVVENGNRHLHATSGRVIFHLHNGDLSIHSLDAPLVAPGKPSLLDFNNDFPDLSAGLHFNLLNNLWGTNFPMWFEEDCRFRFQLKFARCSD